MDMNLQLRQSGQGRQSRHGGDLARLQIETGAPIDIAECEFHQVTGEIRRDVLKAR